ncbi:hypothetical protein BDK51DRAFT_25878 [Blyttiomyces helicus]|uniref:Transmembrane protein n=1 Tax=Blyttiomyces helicus TaxID=388810 RepID=A0A4P9VUC5_9FUNG|nr:hypothetical protein BDK51DRAFT_25878 [Blyttiomyces helicus]|eukprot:RKO83189.1 hypothetical protein BDK51DRAFT_25878 [Blyttiomyces helicus]
MASPTPKPVIGNRIVSLFNQTSSALRPYVGMAHEGVMQAIATGKTVLDRYPPIKSFVYTLGAASAIPVAVFTGYAATSGTIIVSIAGTWVAFVQGGFLLFGAFFLFWWLLGAFIVACISSFWFTMAYLAFQVGKRIEA